MKKILLMVLPILVSLCLGAAGSIYLLRVKPHLATAAPASKEVPTQNLALEERTVNLADTPPDTHYLRTSVVVEVSGKGKVEELSKERMPQLMDRLIDVISREYYSTLIHPSGKEQLKERLSRAFDKELAEKGWSVHRVLFVDFVME